MRTQSAARLVRAAIPLCAAVLLVGGCGGEDTKPSAARPEAQASKPRVERPKPNQPPQSGADKQVLEFSEALENRELPVDMRTWVVGQLADMKGPKATEALLDAADDPEPQVAVAALRALAGRHDDRIRAAAEKAKADGRPEVERAAEDLLESLE